MVKHLNYLSRYCEKILKMKQIAYFLSFVAIIMFGFTPKKNNTYTVDVEKSSITWIGRKVTGEHTGKIKIASGKLIADAKTLKGGEFLFDMKTITCTDLSGEYRDKLVGHLKSEDFFSVDKYPTAKFELLKIVPIAKNKATITGKLTIKGITQSISFPAVITISDKLVKADAQKVLVDRTLFDIRYGSKSFFNIGDKAIDNDFELNINLIANL